MYEYIKPSVANFKRFSYLNDYVLFNIPKWIWKNILGQYLLILRIYGYTNQS